MDKKYKLSYNPPRVVAVSFKVDNGMQVSLDASLLTPFDDASWDSPSTSSSTNHFGSGDWSSGSSFSNNNSFGSGSWDY